MVVIVCLEGGGGGIVFVCEFNHVHVYVCTHNSRQYSANTSCKFQNNEEKCHGQGALVYRLQPPHSQLNTNSKSVH